MVAPKPLAISAVTAVRLFHYDAKTGLLTNRVDRGNAKAGEIVGVITKDGRRRLKIKGRQTYATRLIWLYCYGYLPLVEIDHIDGNKGNDRLLNLRLCKDDGYNAHNQRHAHIDSETGLIGAWKRERARGFRSAIKVGDTMHYLGSFATAPEANAAYVQAKRRLHKFGTL